MADKSMFRCTFKFTEERFKHVPESNIFLRSTDIVAGEKLGRETFKLIMIAGHVPEDSPYEFAIKPSTDNEAILYAQEKRAGKWDPKVNTARSLN